MKFIVYVVFAMIPLASHATFGPNFPLKLKGMYFKSSGPEDDCMKVPKDVVKVETGTELQGFDCTGMKAGATICLCVGEEVNGKIVGSYSNLCGECNMAVRPKPGFTRDFMFWKFYSHVQDSVKSTAELAKDKEATRGREHTDNLILPTIPLSQMVEFSKILVDTAKRLNLPPSAKVIVYKKMMELFNKKKLMGMTEKLLGSHGVDEKEMMKMRMKIMDAFKKIVPRMAKLFDCNESIDLESIEFQQKVQAVMGMIMTELMRKDILS